MTTELPNLNHPQQLTMVDKQDIATMLVNGLFEKLSNELISTGTSVVSQVSYTVHMLRL